MSHNLMYSRDLSLASTSAYVDAILTVKYDENGNSSSTRHNSSRHLSTQFKVHRIVLSRLSNYFRDAFKRLEVEKKSESELNEDSTEQTFWALTIGFVGKKEKIYFTLFPNLLDFLYGKPLTSQEPNYAFEFLELASRFQVPRLGAVVSDLLLTGITRESSFPLLRKALEFNATVVYDRCLEIVARNFQAQYAAIKHQLNDMPLHAFSSLMNHPSLSIASEYRVYKVVRSFYNNNVDEEGVSVLEKSDRKALFSAVRLAHLKYHELEKVIRDEIVPKSLITEALTHRLTQFEKPSLLPPEESLPLRLRKRGIGRLFEPPYARGELQGAATDSFGTQTAPPLASSFSSPSLLSSSSSLYTPLPIHTGGTSSAADLVPKGVIYFLATNSGKSEWKNPSLTGSIKVSFSSIEKGKTHNLVDLEPQDCWSMDIPASWVAIDLRQGKLIPSHFTLRHGGNSKMDTLRNWLIQACDNDGDRWIEISRHSSDASLQGAFGMHTWKITTDQQRPFRQFRILQTGHNSGNTNFLSLSYIELYGLYFPKNALT